MAELREYQSKRDFTRTGEPRGRPARGGDTHAGDMHAGDAGFVIQHHAASRDHYDFRLEVDGVLKSWAVPKGPSVDPRDKRLAVPTEDHPLEYASFEGTIPAGEYGGGTVMVWDTGTYANTTRRKGEAVSMAGGIAAGHVTFDLRGTKLTGGFALTRTRTGGNESWLLVKKDDADASGRRKPVVSAPRSAVTGRTMRQIERATPATTAPAATGGGTTRRKQS